MLTEGQAVPLLIAGLVPEVVLFPDPLFPVPTPTPAPAFPPPVALVVFPTPAEEPAELEVDPLRARFEEEGVQ